jgi:hypothetical protein
MSTKKKVTKVNKENLVDNFRVSGNDHPCIRVTADYVSKSATILYKRLPDDMILITGFENFMRFDDIVDKYGRVVAITYNNYPSRISGDVFGVILYGNNGKPGLHVGDICKKVEFSEIIAHVKKCGGLLHGIIEAVNNGEVKKITI